MDGKEILDIPTVSLYLENAMYGDLYLFVIDIDTKHETAFIKKVEAAADFVTVSKNNGRHAYFGIRKETELFDSINLLSSSNAKGFIDKTALRAEDGTKFDVFCDTPRFIYEWQIWDNRPLSDKTQVVFDLLKDIEIRRSAEYTTLTDAAGNFITLEALSESELLEQMTERQRLVFEDLKTISADCTQREWFSIGCDINAVFGGWNDDTNTDLGGSVWLWWSRQGASFQPQSCANTWGVICNKENRLNRSKWQDIMFFTALDVPTMANKNSTDIDDFDIDGLCPKEDIPSVLSPNAAYEWVANEAGWYLLKYDGIPYDDKADFLAETLGYYFPVAYRVKYNTDDIFWLSGNQRARLSYHILDTKIGAKPISVEDDSILKSIAKSGTHEAAQRWLGRMNWDNGNAKMITFGVGLEVKGAANGVYCYRPEYHDNKATFAAVKMTWERWSEKIIDALDGKQYRIDDVIMMIYYQDGVYMTLPFAEQKAIKAWIYKDYRLGEPFPYSGAVPNNNVNFAIDFDRDCRIVKSKSLRHNGNMAAHNRENAAELAAARGKVRKENAANADYEKLVGDEWTTAQLKEMLGGDYERKIRRLIAEKKIDRARIGFYRRKLC
jgi:Primase C terminal 2 (PriCT-2).